MITNRSTQKRFHIAFYSHHIIHNLINNLVSHHETNKSLDMGQFLAKMEEKAANTIKITKKKSVGIRTSKSDHLSDYELSRMTLTKKLPQVIHFLLNHFSLLTCTRKCQSSALKSFQQ